MTRRQIRGFAGVVVVTIATCAVACVSVRFMDRDERPGRTRGKYVEWVHSFLTVAPARQVLVDGRPGAELTTGRGVFRCVEGGEFVINDDRGMQRYAVRAVSKGSVEVDYEHAPDNAGPGSAPGILDRGTVILRVRPQDSSGEMSHPCLRGVVFL